MDEDFKLQVLTLNVSLQFGKCGELFYKTWTYVCTI